MKQYTNFASVYDTLMDNIPYGDWCSYVAGLLWDNEVPDGTIAELGCGTGTAAMHMVHLGYKVLGIDNSRDMLNVARSKQTNEYVRRIRYSLQDMRSFSLKRPVRAMYSICDSINYLTKRDDLIQTLRCVRENLLPGGIFIFDMKTRYFYESILGNSTIADNYPDCSLIWENHYNKRNQIHSYRLSIFVRLAQNIYRHFLEVHKQKSYSVSEISDAVTACGLQLLHAYDAFTMEPPKKDSERIYFVVKKGDKNE